MQKFRILRRLVFLAFASVLFSACGKFNRLDDGGFTEVRFTRSFQSYDFETQTTLTTGLMIYAYSANYITNLHLSSEDDPNKSITLPNGQYSFYAFGYDSSGTLLSSGVRCG